MSMPTSVTRRRWPQCSTPRKRWAPCVPWCIAQVVAGGRCAWDLAQRLIRVCTIAPGLFDTHLLARLPENVKASLGAVTPTALPNVASIQAVCPLSLALAPLLFLALAPLLFLALAPLLNISMALEPHSNLCSILLL